MDHPATNATDTTQQGPQLEFQQPSEASGLPQHVSQAGNVLEVDSERSSLSASTLQDDRDSAYGDTSDVESAFTSISSSVRDYRKENGRTYHAYKDGRYHLPNDEIEASRLDLQHHLFLLTLDGRLSLAPIGNNLQNVLDVGTGTGIWALDFADQHPQTKVIGTDLSPVQPEFVAPNTVFVIDDSEETWAYNHKFDYIHGRMLVVAIKDFPRLLEQCYENLNPGCWVEMQDICLPVTSDDGSLPPDSPLAKWSSLVIEAGGKVGFDPSGTSKFATQMAAAGFINIQETVYKWPLNSWPKGKKDKLLGRWANADISEGVQGISMAFLTRVLGWTQQEVEVFLVDVRKDLRDKSKHSYIKLYVVYGQKPEHSNQQLHDDSVFGSSTAHQAEPQSHQDEDMLSSGSPQEPPHRQDQCLSGSNSVTQPQKQQSESSLSPNATKPPQEPEHRELSYSRTALQSQPDDYQDQDMTGSSDFHKSRHRPGEVLPYAHDSQLPQELEHRDLSDPVILGQTRPQHQPDTSVYGTSSAHERSHQQRESLLDSHSVQQYRAQQDIDLVGLDGTKQSQQHLHEDSLGSVEGQKPLPQHVGAPKSGSNDSKQSPSH